MLNLRDLPQRLREHIAHEPETGCWIWHGSQGDDGHGMVIHWGKRWQANWLFWTLAHGTIPVDQGVDPCVNPLCVNPEHLRLVALPPPERAPKRALTFAQVLAIRQVYAAGH